VRPVEGVWGWRALLFADTGEPVGNLGVVVLDGFPGSGPAAGRGQGWLQLDVAKVVEGLDEMPVDLVADLVAQLFEPRLALTCHDEGGEPAAVAAGEVDTALVAPPQDDALALVLLRHRFRQAGCLPHEPRHIVRVPYG